MEVQENDYEELLKQVKAKQDQIKSRINALKLKMLTYLNKEHLNVPEKFESDSEQTQKQDSID